MNKLNAVNGRRLWMRLVQDYLLLIASAGKRRTQGEQQLVIGKYLDFFRKYISDLPSVLRILKAKEMLFQQQLKNAYLQIFQRKLYFRF